MTIANDPVSLGNELLEKCKTLTESCILIMKDVQKGRLSIDEAKECLELDRMAMQRAMREFTSLSIKRGYTLTPRLSREIDKARTESTQAFFKCQSYLNNQVVAA